MKSIHARSRRNRIVLGVHIVWTTYRRAPMVTKELEERVYRTILAEAQKLDATVLAVNGMPDHVHLIVLLPSTVSLAKLLQQVKGVSAHAINGDAVEGVRLRWADGYSAFALCREQRDAAIAYVRNQKRHHADLSLRRGWEETDLPSTEGDAEQPAH